MPRPSFDILGIGENSLDLVYRVQTLPHRGGATKLPALAFARRPGGQVATMSAACSALGLRAAYLGVFGDDENGRLVRDALIARGVDVGGAPVRPGASRHAVILVEHGTGERIIVSSRDPSLRLSPADVNPAVVSSAAWVHVDATDEEIAMHAARLARAAGVPTTTDIDEATARTRELMLAVSVPIFADGVVEALTGHDGIEAALRALRREHPGLLCVTRGEQGAVLLEDDTLHVEPAFAVKAVDTTGAGDVFRAGFVAAALRGAAPKDALRFATAAAAVSCTREGAMDGVPTRAEVEALLRQRTQPT